jgi:phosphoglycolate phosphatase-like HAD superfamily hydrolase
MCSRGEASSIVEDTNRLELELIATEGEVYEGTLDVLEDLRREEFCLALCSNGPQDYVDAFLEAHKVRHYFQEIRARGFRHVEKADMVREILEIQPARPVFVVGDRGDDIQAARANDCFAIASQYGFGSKEEWADADIQIGSVRDVPSAIESILTR